MTDLRWGAYLGAAAVVVLTLAVLQYAGVFFETAGSVDVRFLATVAVVFVAITVALRSAVAFARDGGDG